jgi:hypothetical protein
VGAVLRRRRSAWGPDSPPEGAPHLPHLRHSCTFLQSWWVSGWVTLGNLSDYWIFLPTSSATFVRKVVIGRDFMGRLKKSHTKCFLYKCFLRPHFDTLCLHLNILAGDFSSSEMERSFMRDFSNLDVNYG